MVATLTDAILNYLNGDYTLSTGERVQGNSLSFVMQSLRYDGWRLPGQMDFENEIEKLGFRIVRGRGMRWYAGGKQNLGVPCNVVTL